VAGRALSALRPRDARHLQPDIPGLAAYAFLLIETGRVGINY
jgi:hypothetical protein